MHSSRMRTGRSLTVCWSLLPGVVCSGGGGGGWGGGMVSVLGGSVCSGGSALGGSALGGVCSWGCLLPGGWCLLPGGGGASALGGPGPRGRGVWSQGVCSGGLLQGGIPACTEADTLPAQWTESQTPVKTLPWPNFIAAGNKEKRKKHKDSGDTRDALPWDLPIKEIYINTGSERLIRSHSSARFCFELSRNLN